MTTIRGWNVCRSRHGSITPRRSAWPRIWLAVATVGVGAALSAPARAAPYTWRGSGTSGLWSFSGNWTGGGLTTGGTHGVFYSGSTKLSGTVNGTYTLDTLQFNPTATGSFVINGSAGSRINMRGDIVNRSGVLQTIQRVNIDYGTDSVTRTIDVGTGTIALNAIIAPSAGTTIEKRGTGALVFGSSAGLHSFTGTLALTEGTTNLSAGLPGSVQVTSGAVLYLNSSRNTIVTIQSLTNSGTTVVIGDTVVSDASMLAGDGVVSFATLPDDGVGQLTFLGPATLSGTLFIDVTKPYLDATWESPQLFSLFGFSERSGDFTSVLARYDGRMVSFRQGGFDDPTLWVSDPTAGGQVMTFSTATGHLSVVPEPSTIVIAGIGGVMTAWNVFMRHRRRVRARRPSFES